MKITFDHIRFLLLTVGTNAVLAFAFGNPSNCVCCLLMLILPCNDPQFGRRRKYFWARQTALTLGAAACYFAGLVDPFNIWKHSQT